MIERSLQETAPANYTEQFQNQVLSSVMTHAERYLYPSHIAVPGRGISNRLEEVPYHRFQHALGVYERAIEYCDYAEAHGKKPDRFALGLASVLHDARFVDDVDMASIGLKRAGIIRRRLKNKEDHSAVVSGVLLESYGVDFRTISKVKRLIRVTASDATPRTLEERIIIRSDLDGITKDSDSFFTNTLGLIREAELLNGPKNPFERIGFMHSLLGEHVLKDLSLGDFDNDNYKKVFHQPAVANVVRISSSEIRETIKRFGGVALILLHRDN